METLFPAWDTTLLFLDTLLLFLDTPLLFLNTTLLFLDTPLLSCTLNLHLDSGHTAFLFFVFTPSFYSWTLDSESIHWTP